MVHYIKKHLYHLGIYKQLDTIDKITLLLKYPIDPYKGHLEFKGFTSNIIQSLNILKIIDSTNITNKLVNIPRVSEEQWQDKELANWYTNNGLVLTDSKIYTNWLTLSKSVLTKFDKNIANTSTLSINTRFFSPYRLEISNIVDIMFTKLK